MRKSVERLFRSGAVGASVACGNAVRGWRFPSGRARGGARMGPLRHWVAPFWRTAVSGGAGWRHVGPMGGGLAPGGARVGRSGRDRTPGSPPWYPSVLDHRIATVYRADRAMCRTARDRETPNRGMLARVGRGMRKGRIGEGEAAPSWPLVWCPRQDSNLRHPLRKFGPAACPPVPCGAAVAASERTVPPLSAGVDASDGRHLTSSGVTCDACVFSPCVRLPCAS